MKRKYLIMGIIVLIIVFIIGIRLFSGEDDWIKDGRGVWIKHGNPAVVPENVEKQQEAIDCAIRLYNNAKSNGTSFNSQCLGVCGDYSVDVVHVPRAEGDNLVENQCSDYREGKVKGFIELDKEGKVVKIVE